MVTIDEIQLKRIEATHSGFLYQHLFATAQLLSSDPAIEGVIVENDEDVEVFTASQHLYSQVKMYAAPLQPSDVAPILDRFALIRAEHASGRRTRSCAFAIVSRSEPSPSLAVDLANVSWPRDVSLVSPMRKGTVLGVPAWDSLTSALDWCVAKATAVPFSKLAPETLVWKLAAYVQALASGRLFSGSHEVRMSDIPRLREQLDLFSEFVPAPPAPYRMQQGEPEISSGSRVRCIVGVSGAGKTAWLSAATEHYAGNVIFARASTNVGDVVGWIVRNLAANLLRSHGDMLSSIFRPGAVSDESLRLLDAFASNNPVTIVIDSAHLTNTADLARAISETEHFRWLLLSQPGPGATDLSARLAIAPEELKGWDAMTVGAALRDAGLNVDAEDAARLQRLCAGAPLFVQSTAQVAKAHYKGDLGQLLDEQSRGTHSTGLPQETIIARDVMSALSERARNTAALISPVRSELTADLLRRVISGTFSAPPAQAASVLRELTEWNILRPAAENAYWIHDVFRPACEIARLGLDDTLRTRGLTLILEVLKDARQSGSSVEGLLDILRVLTELGDGKTVVDIIYGGVEWFNEFGAGREVELLLQESLTRPDIPTDFQFLGSDALAFLLLQKGDADASTPWIARCEALAAEKTIRIRDWEGRIAIKRILAAKVRGDYPAAKLAYEEYEAWAVAGSEGHRVARYNLAVAAHSTGHLDDSIDLCTQLIQEYFALFRIRPSDVFAKNSRDLKKIIDVRRYADEVRHLADCLYLRAIALADAGRESGPDSMWSMKFYETVLAKSSTIRSGLEAARVILSNGDISGALDLFEKTLVPNIERHRMMGWVTSVYMDGSSGIRVARK